MRFTFSKEVKTAIIVLGGLLLFLLGFNYLKGNRVFSNNRIFYVVYDHAGGLVKSAPVSINGLQIGKIEDIAFLDSTGKSLVTFSVSSDFTFSKNSIVEAFDASFLGGKNLQVVLTFDNAPIAKHKDTLQGRIKQGMTDMVSQTIDPLQKELSLVLQKTNTVLSAVEKVLDTTTQIQLKHTLANLNTTVSHFKNSATSLDGLLQNNKASIASSLKNVDKITHNFATLSDSLQQVNIGKTLSKLQHTVATADQLLASINKGEGSVGKLLKDDAMYTNLTQASKELELLLEDMRLQPKRYVHFSLFGKKPKPYTPVKKDTILQ